MPEIPPLSPGLLDKLRLLFHGSSYPELTTRLAGLGPSSRVAVRGLQNLHDTTLPLFFGHAVARAVVPPFARAEDYVLDQALSPFRPAGAKQAAWTDALSFLDRPGRLVYGWKPSQLVGHGAAAGGLAAVGIPAARLAWNAVHSPPETPAAPPGFFDQAGEAISNHPYATGAAALGTAGLLTALLSSRRKIVRRKNARLEPCPTMNPFLHHLKSAAPLEIMPPGAGPWDQAASTAGRGAARAINAGSVLGTLALPAWLGHHYKADPTEAHPLLKGLGAGTAAGGGSGALLGALMPRSMRTLSGMGRGRLAAGSAALGSLAGLLSSLTGSALTRRPPPPAAPLLKASGARAGFAAPGPARNRAEWGAPMARNPRPAVAQAAARPSPASFLPPNARSSPPTPSVPWTPPPVPAPEATATPPPPDQPAATPPPSPALTTPLLSRLTRFAGGPLVRLSAGPSTAPGPVSSSLP